MSALITQRSFIIDSHIGKRTSGTDSNFDFKINYPPSETYDRVVVKTAKIPKSYYTIPAGQNTFTLIELGASRTITVPVGCYSATTFCTVVAPLLTAASALNGNNWTYTMTIPNGTTRASTGKITYTSSAGNPSIQTLGGKSNLYQQLGFDAGTTNTFTASTITSQNVVSFQQATTLLIKSNIADNGGDNTLCAVFVAGSPDFSIINYQLQTHPDIASKKMKITNGNSYNFSITDEDDIVLELNGQNVVFEIILYKSSALSAISDASNKQNIDNIDSKDSKEPIKNK